MESRALEPKDEGARLIRLDSHGDDATGYLSVFETHDIGFDVARIYYIYDVPCGIQRGMHAHPNLKQALFCPYGSIEVSIDDGRGHKDAYMLDEPSKCLIVPERVWREMVWREQGSVLVVAASLPYDQTVYIRDYSEFLDLVG